MLYVVLHNLTYLRAEKDERTQINNVTLKYYTIHLTIKRVETVIRIRQLLF